MAYWRIGQNKERNEVRNIKFEEWDRWNEEKLKLAQAKSKDFRVDKTNCNYCKASRNSAEVSCKINGFSPPS